MYVGVILTKYPQIYGRGSIPHVCGGDPFITVLFHHIIQVFPMYVGVILIYLPRCRHEKRIPHVCGGDPLVKLCHLVGV